MSLRSSETTQRIPQKVLTSSRNVDECKALVIGACVGRLVGLGLVDIAATWGYSAADLAAGGAATAWVDPGVFALLGAGAFRVRQCRL